MTQPLGEPIPLASIVASNTPEDVLVQGDMRIHRDADGFTNADILWDVWDGTKWIPVVDEKRPELRVVFHLLVIDHIGDGQEWREIEFPGSDRYIPSVGDAVAYEEGNEARVTHKVVDYENNKIDIWMKD